jgi:hypothetical protein
MPFTKTFANGQTLTSSAMAPDDLNKILQTLALAVLDIDPTQDAQAYSKVRVAWTTQPGFTFSDDVVSIQTKERDDAYSKIRDRKYTPNDGVSAVQTDTYSRTWEATFVCYGPNGFANASLIKSAMNLDFVHDTLKASALALVTDFGAVVRAPELRDGQWWQRSDWRVRIYERVTESLTVPTVASVEVKLYSDLHGLVADIRTP